MARLKAGLIVTEIKGKLGGSTFRETSNGLVISGKSRGGAVGVLQANNSLALIAAINKEFGKLDENERDKWRELAKRHPYIDSFGDTRYLTGKGLYVKLRSNLKMSKINLIDVDNISSYVPIVKVDEVKLGLNSDKLIKFIGDDKSVVIRLQVVRVSDLNSAFNNRRNKILKTLNFLLSDTMNFTNEFNARFPYAKENDIYQLSLTAVNSSGFKALINYTNQKLKVLSLEYHILLQHSLSDRISKASVLLTNDFSFEFDMYISDITSPLYVCYGGGVLVLFMGDGTIRYKGVNGITHSTNAGVVKEGQRAVYRFVKDSGRIIILVDDVEVLNVADTFSFNLREMLYQYTSNAIIRLYEFRINGNLYDFSIGNGAFISAPNEIDIELKSNSNVNNMWVLNS